MARRMSSILGRSAKKAGLPPGTLVHTGEQMVDEVILSSLSYNQTGFKESKLSTIDDALAFLDGKEGIKWLNVDGMHNPSIVEEIGKKIGLHPLVMEDTLSMGQRPKVEDLERHLFIVLKMIYLNKTGGVEAEQVSLVIGEDYVISFQERPGDVFEVIRDRIRTGKGRIRKMGPDYLAYAIIDAIVDSYFVVLETLGDAMEGLENDVMSTPAPETLHSIHSLKREMIFLRKSVWPLREVIGTLMRGGSPIIREDTIVYMRDIYDHTIQVVDTIETMRDMLSGMLDIYLSSISNRMNEVMKVLTIIATIFIPLTFIAGVYGMNFDYMPELKWRMGYLMTLSIMLVVSMIMLVFFRRKKWI